MATRPHGHVPPHDLDAEASLIGAALLTRDAITKALDARVNETDFYKPAHAVAWQSILSLFADDQPINPLSVTVHLRHTGKLAKVGNRETLEQLAAGSTVHNAGYCAQVVHTAAEERRLLTLATELVEAVYSEAPTDHIVERLTHPRTSDAHGWGAIDLATIITGDLEPPEPSILARDDHRCLLYPGRIHAFNGESESLKSWLALHATAQELRAGNDVAYLDFEDTAQSIASRLIALGLDRTDIVSGLIYIRPEQPLDVAAGSHLERLIVKRDPRLVVVDGVTEAMGLENLDLLDNADIARWLDKLPRRLRNLGPAILLIDHVTKNVENRRRGGIGGQHKLAGIDVSYVIESKTPLAHVAAGDFEPITGTSTITIEKDRPGGVRAFAVGRRHIGELQITAYPDRGVTAHIVAATERAAGGFRPTILMERISETLAKSSTPLTKRALRGLVKGNSEAKDAALELLVGDGYVTVEKGTRGAQLHRSVRAYHAADHAPDDAAVDEPMYDDEGNEETY